MLNIRMKNLNRSSVEGEGKFLGISETEGGRKLANLTKIR